RYSATARWARSFVALEFAHVPRMIAAPGTTFANSRFAARTPAIWASFQPSCASALDSVVCDDWANNAAPAENLVRQPQRAVARPAIIAQRAPAARIFRDSQNQDLRSPKRTG